VAGASNTRGRDNPINMAVATSVLADNAAQLRRLEAVVARLGPRDRDLGSGWTAGVALAHLAFWDRRAALFLDYWQRHGTGPNERHDADILNAALLDEWRLLSVRESGRLAVSAANSVNTAVEALDDTTADAIIAGGHDRLLHRARHRREHIDQIESALE
jgi:hypothetical protein